MLWLASDSRFLAYIFSAADVPAGRRFLCRTWTEKSLERGHGLAAPVVSEDELVPKLSVMDWLML